MSPKERRSKIYDLLKCAGRPLTGSELASQLAVSRQIIVGDISIIRAGGVDVYATPQGYLMPREVKNSSKKVMATLTCRHNDVTSVAAELNLMVDNGAKVLDVIVEHPIYGEIRADLMINSRRDVAKFVQKLEQYGASQLSLLTGGLHLHTLEADSEESIAAIRRELGKSGILHETEAE